MNLFSKKALLAAVLAVVTIPAFAQKEITFESTSASSGKHKKFESGTGDQTISVGTLSWFNGYVPFYYERAMLDMLSLQAGVGFTTRSFGGDFGFLLDEFGQNSNNYNGENMYDVEDDYTHYQFRNATPGLYLSFAPKIYYTNDVMDGMWLAPMVEYKNFRYNAQMADETAPIVSTGGDDRLIPHTSEVFKEHINCVDFSIHWGSTYELEKHFTIGWSTGFGIRTSKGERLDIGIYDDNSGTEHYMNKVAYYEKTKPFFAFNLTIGGWF